jgi:hypothetical protein
MPFAGIPVEIKQASCPCPDPLIGRFLAGFNALILKYRNQFRRLVGSTGACLQAALF